MEYYEEYMGIVETCDNKIVMCSWTFAIVTRRMCLKWRGVFKVFLQALDCKFINHLYMNKVNMVHVEITHEWRFLCMGLAVLL